MMGISSRHEFPTSSVVVRFYCTTRPTDTTRLERHFVKDPLVADIAFEPDVYEPRLLCARSMLVSIPSQ